MDVSISIKKCCGDYCNTNSISYCLCFLTSVLMLSKLIQNDIQIFTLKKKKHRFEPFEYLYLRIMSITGGQTNTMRHNYLYRYFQDTVPRFQFLTKLSEACAFSDTDRPHVLAYERSKFLRACLLSCCRQRACGGQ